MAFNRGLVKGVGRREAKGNTIKGPLRIKLPQSNVVHYTTVVGTGWGTTNSPGQFDHNSLSGLLIECLIDTSEYTEAQFSPNGQPLVINDWEGAPIFAVPYTGGPCVFGDKTSAGPGVFGPFTGIDGSIAEPPVYFTTGGSTPMRIYGGTGVPTTFLASVACNVGDYYFRQDGTTSTTHIYRCTTAGTPGTWTGFA